MMMIAALVLTVMASADARVELVVDPFVDLWFSVRALSTSREPVEVPELLKPAVEAARALDRELGGAPVWGIIEGLLGTCHDAAAATKAFASVPETYKTRAEKV